MLFVVLVGFCCCRVVLAIIGIPTSLLQNNDEGILDQGKLQFSVYTVVVQCMHMHCIITVSIAELQLILILWRGIVFLVFLIAWASPNPPRVAQKNQDERHAASKLWRLTAAVHPG
jgi:hypothetical protein